MEIEYKEFTLELFDGFQDKKRPILEDVVVSIDGVPLADCDSKTKMRAGFEVMRFFTTEMQDMLPSSSNNTNSDGDS